MNFNSLEFLILFLPATLVAFYAVPMRLRLWVLVAASLVFYGVSGFEVLLALLIAIIWGYCTAFLFGKWPRPLAIIVAISVPILFLIMFKYLTFIMDSIHAGPQARDHFWFFFSILLPAGISFYTFEIVSYSLDVADGKIERDSDLLRFASFATFFPHLIAGPIMRYANLRQQLQMLQSTQILKPNLASGLKFLSIGLLFKVFVADVSGMKVANATGVPLEQLTAIDQFTQIQFWAAQIYYDFWAYSVMAIGLGRLFCIELPVNFREPYLSQESPRILAAVARHPLVLAARLCVYPDGWSRRLCPKHPDCVRARRLMARGGLEFCGLGYLSRGSGHRVSFHRVGMGPITTTDRHRLDLHPS